jgi:hypothetical protein
MWVLRQLQRIPSLEVGLMICIREGHEGIEDFEPSLSLLDSPPLTFLGLWPQVTHLSRLTLHSCK